MVVVSCPGKFHAFSLAEQLQKHYLLKSLLTGYASQKNTLFSKFAGRVDKENILPQNIKTFLPWAILKKLNYSDDYTRNEYFDNWTAKQLRKIDYKIFIGWASISLQSIRQAKKDGRVTIIERGSSHISFQNEILTEEYAKYGIDFKIDQRVIEKELTEYEEADFISIPSQFVKGTFISNGVQEKKLLLNNYGTSSFFKPVSSGDKVRPFRILYVGAMTIRKGLRYMFEALSKLDFPHEVWFVGSMEEDSLKRIYDQHKRTEWLYHGKINHYDLPEYISNCDVAIQPSIEEGLSMVIPQIMGCGVPVIATTNSGGADLIIDGVSGYVVPIRSASAIAEKLNALHSNQNLMQKMKNACLAENKNLTWQKYGDRYSDFLRNLDL